MSRDEIVTEVRRRRAQDGHAIANAFALGAIESTADLALHDLLTGERVVPTARQARRALEHIYALALASRGAGGEA